MNIKTLTSLAIASTLLLTTASWASGDRYNDDNHQNRNQYSEYQSTDRDSDRNEYKKREYNYDDRYAYRGEEREDDDRYERSSDRDWNNQDRL